MPAFVVLALALAVMAVGAVFVSVRRLRTELRRLGAVTATTTTRLRPLLDELQDEAAVTAIELEEMQRRRTRPNQRR